MTPKRDYRSARQIRCRSRAAPADNGSESNYSRHSQTLSSSQYKRVKTSNSNNHAFRDNNFDGFDNSSVPVPIINLNPLPVDNLSIPLLENFPGGGGGGNPFGNQDEIKPEPVDPTIDLSSVGGLEEQVEYIRKNILYPMEHPEEFADWGIEPTKGVIFHGPPGTGKTLLAKALVSELYKNGNKVNFFMRKGSDCYSKWIGDSEKTLRELFRVATALKPSIIFFDELDGLCPSRETSNHHFYTTVVTCLLGQIDGIKRGEVFVIAATNRLDAIDPALKRPGRFDKALAFLPPNEAARNQILNTKLDKWRSNKPSKELIASLARQTVGFTGADLEQLCRNAFDCALDRQMPNLGKANCGTNYTIKNLRVIEQDWILALSKIGSSNSNVFGNAVYTGSNVHPLIQPLINGIVSEVVLQIKQFLPNVGNPVCDSTCKGTGIKSLLVYSNTIPTANVVDSLILPSVMASFDVQKTPGFILSNLVLQGTSLTTALEQVTNCRKNCFLFVPRIDKLWDVMIKIGSQDILKNQLINITRATNIILVASSITGLANLPEELSAVFDGMNREYKVRKPNDKERREFFAYIFSPESKFMKNVFDKCGKNIKVTIEKFEKLACLAQKFSQDQEIESMFALQGELAQVCSKYSSENNIKVDDLLKEMDNILDEYKKNKLRK